MFEDLRDSVSMVFSRTWPTADGQITGVSVYPYDRGGVQFALTYTFSISNDGPYTGESRSPQWFPGEMLAEIKDKFRVGQKVVVRYRPGCPAVNQLDHSTWDELTDGVDEL
jgi:hypothetical protein